MQTSATSFVQAHNTDAATENTPPPATGTEPRHFADAAMAEYVGYLAGWFDIGRLAAGRRLVRERGRAPESTDA